ncbi:MAG: TIGR03936 family radical SAM-associated protein [Raoultibacter sp.]|jgi:radical SAM-linked protein
MSDTSFRIRVYFEIKGRLALLSHLELARALERMVRRAELPYQISQGFSPHMKIAFGSALPVGIGGLRECFDLQITRYIAPDKILDALCAQGTDDLKALSVDYIDKRYPAASVAFPLSRYQVVFSSPLKRELLVPESLTVIRKKKERELIVSEYLIDGPTLNGTELSFSLLAKPTGSLRPDVFLSALLGQDSDAEILSFMRIDQQSA